MQLRRPLRQIKDMLFLVKRLKITTFLLTLMVATNAHSQVDPVSQRLDFIQTALHNEAKRARTWTYAWHASLAAFTVGQAAAYPFVSDGDRIDLYYGIGSDLVGHAFLIAFPLKSMNDSEELDALIEQQRDQGASPELLSRAEFFLQRSAEDERQARDWKVHLGNALFNVGLGVTLGLVHDRWLSGGIFIGSGIAIGEVMILTQPNRLKDQLKRYREGNFEPLPEKSSRNWDLYPMLTTDVVGANLRIRF